jgi:hypothetical protein
LSWISSCTNVMYTPVGFSFLLFLVLLETSLDTKMDLADPNILLYTSMSACAWSTWNLEVISPPVLDKLSQSLLSILIQNWCLSFQVSQIYNLTFQHLERKDFSIGRNCYRIQNWIVTLLQYRGIKNVSVTLLPLKRDKKCTGYLVN